MNFMNFFILFSILIKMIKYIINKSFNNNYIYFLHEILKLTKFFINILF